MSKVFTANRVAALAGFVASLGTTIAAFAGALPHADQQAAAAVAGTLGQIATVLMYLRGSQKYDELTAGTRAVDKALLGSTQGAFDSEPYANAALHPKPVSAPGLNPVPGGVEPEIDS